MVPVDDDAAPALLVVKGRADYAGLPRSQLRHGVEQMGEAAKAVAERFRDAVSGSVAVPRANQHSGIAQPSDRFGRHLFRGQRYDCPAPGAPAHDTDLFLVDRPEFLRVVDALFLDVQERPLDVDSKNTRNAGGDRRTHGFERSLDLVGIVADERRKETSSP